MSVTEALRTRLGRVGVWTNVPAIAEPAVAREVAAEIEELGYGALWYPEAVWKESFSVAALVLSWTNRLVVASGITNIYARDATSAARSSILGPSAARRRGAGSAGSCAMYGAESIASR